MDGTLLMGPDSWPRIVAADSIVHGVAAAAMSTVTPGRQSGAEPFTVCGDRPIALVNHTRPGVIHDRLGVVNLPWKATHWDVTYTMQQLSTAHANEADAYGRLEEPFGRPEIRWLQRHTLWRDVAVLAVLRAHLQAGEAAR